jgi:hypothetical protein
VLRARTSCASSGLAHVWSAESGTASASRARALEAWNAARASSRARRVGEFLDQRAQPRAGLADACEIVGGFVQTPRLRLLTHPVDHGGHLGAGRSQGLAHGSHLQGGSVLGGGVKRR